MYGRSDTSLGGGGGVLLRCMTILILPSVWAGAGCTWPLWDMWQSEGPKMMKMQPPENGQKGQE